MRFEDLGLEPKVLQAVAEAGYESPTPIQEQSIPEALKGRDVLGIAQTGTGKTASFVLPMIDRLSKGRAKARMPRSLVICPTRELAAQVAENFEKYGKYHKLTMALLIGGVSFADQDAKLTRGVDVLIATPGRLLDHFERGKLLLTGVQILVVDEADRMLDMGFIPDIERIFKLTPFTRQTLFFSATMPPEIQRLTDQFLSAPARVEVARQSTTADTVEQKIVRVPTKDERAKRMALRKLLDAEDVKNGIIFCNRKSTVDIVAKSLQKYGYNARPIHGDLAQAFRMETLDGFRNGDVRFLIASDVAARGLDIPAVSHVFNFDVPIHAEDYVHRIGRTGRAGREGKTFMLVSPADDKPYTTILKMIQKDALDEVDFGDFFENLPAAPERRPRRGERADGRSSRGGASSGRSRRRPSREEDVTPQAASQENDADVAEAKAPRAKDVAEEASPPRERPRRSRNRKDDARDDRKDARKDNDKVIAFGGDTPAFLARPIPGVTADA